MDRERCITSSTPDGLDGLGSGHRASSVRFDRHDGRPGARVARALRRNGPWRPGDGPRAQYDGPDGPGEPGGPGRGRGRGPGGPRRGRGPGGPGRGGPFGRPGDGELPGFLPPGARVGRGDIRAGILVLLLEGPMHGYQLIHELHERSGGVWRPSPGSVYPTLKRLTADGLVAGVEGEGGGPRKAFALTEAGVEEATRLAAESTPWEALVDGHDRGAIELHDLVVSVVDAARQVVRVAEPSQAAQAKEVLVEARRRLYGILATEPGSAPSPGAGADGAAAPRSTADVDGDDGGSARTPAA